MNFSALWFGALVVCAAGETLLAAAPGGAGGGASGTAAAQPAGKYKGFSVAIYCPQGTLNLNTLERQWATISAQLKVDKVYIETFRSRRYVNEADIEPMKNFFTSRGVKVAGGMTLCYNDSGQFETFSFTNPEQRAMVKAVTEMTARHFDEVILDDFFFYTTKTDADIAAKGDRSWTQFRLDMMRDASKNLVVGPAKAVNPKVKMIIKFPNWYEHFQGLGYDLDQEPKIFDGIYTGTETRDPTLTEQHLQPYESYNIIRYFENIKPGGNGGGWVDTFQYNTVDRYAEQLWDTVFAKAPEMMLFNWSAMQQNFILGQRPWSGEKTSFNVDEMIASAGATAGGQPTTARVAGYALEQADKVVPRLGKPIGLKSYRPYQATGEDFLHNFLGMAGIPIDLYPTYPEGDNTHTILLTEAAKDDPDILKKMKASLAAGQDVVITSGLVKALQNKGLSDICELEYTGNKIQVTSFHRQGGAAIAGSELKAPVIFPEIKFKTNDAWFVLAGVANGNGFPILISDKYGSKGGVLYVLAIPDNFADLYSLPPAVLNYIRGILTRDLPVMVTGNTESQVSLFEYDNNTFIAQNFTGTDKQVTVGVAAQNGIHDMLTEEVLTTAGGRGGRGGRGGGGNNPDLIPVKPTFTFTVPPHSWRAFFTR